MRRVIGIVAAFTLAGPPIGAAAMQFIVAARSVAAGDYHDLANVVAAFPYVIAFSYLLAGPAAFATGTACAIALRFVPGRVKFFVAAAFGFAFSFLWMAFRTDGWGQNGAWPASGAWPFAIVGAIAAVGSLAVFEYFRSVQANRPAS
jgi:hypothetical protein